MTRKRRLLVVEDEPAIQTGLVDVFVFHGYEVEATADGRRGLELATSGRFDLVILDVMLPGMNGFEICEAVRERDRSLPVIMLTARVEDEDIVTGLRLGADDYVGKPFGVQELVLRVEAVLRRAGAGADDAAAAVRTIELDGGCIDCAALDGEIDGRRVSFTRREIGMLCHLARHADRAVSREELLSEVWGYARGLDIETRTVDIHVAKLRRKIEAEPRQPRRLVTVRGAGYRLLAAGKA
ncbi:MAG: response regulator transcription factor [Gammaproteobacteria bacterium]